VKIILNSYTGIGAWFTLRLAEEGHSVDYYQMNKDCLNILRGLAPTPLREKPDYSKYDLSIFDLTGKEKLAELSAAKCPTIGDSALATQLEDDRLFGIEVMEQCGVAVPPYEVFDNIETAAAFVRKEKKRYVFKPFGGQDQKANTTYVSRGWKDLLEFIDKLGEDTKGAKFLLQEFVEQGTEISTEAYFNGEEFFAVNHTLEEKKFMNGNIGPATGCAGNLVWFCNEGRASKAFKSGLEKLGQFLGENSYRGMVDLNSIVTEGELFGLEWTPRFGYDASATLFSLIAKGELGNFLHAVSTGEKVPSDIFKEEWFAAGVRVTVPPYPSEIEGIQQEGVPISGITEENMHKFYLWDCKEDKGQLVTCGEAYGVVCVPIARGQTNNAAFYNVKQLIKELKIPDMQYRTDMHEFCGARYNILDRQGWLRP
jgi:phosphoribosylamine--glycine ligase